MPLYNNPNYENKMAQFQQGGAGAMGAMRPGQTQVTKTKAPPKTAGGAIMNSAGGAMAGEAVGSAVGSSILAGTEAGATALAGTEAGATAGATAGPWGALIGAVLGLGAYYLS